MSCGRNGKMEEKEKARRGLSFKPLEWCWRIVFHRLQTAEGTVSALSLSAFSQRPGSIATPGLSAGLDEGRYA
jgi:hypothetical protein